jgi:hypothetical protein
MAAPNADQDIRLVVFAEVSAETALTILNRFHILPPGTAGGATQIALGEHSNMPPIFV